MILFEYERVNSRKIARGVNSPQCDKKVPGPTAIMPKVWRTVPTAGDLGFSARARARHNYVLGRVRAVCGRSRVRVSAGGRASAGVRRAVAVSLHCNNTHF